MITLTLSTPASLLADGGQALARHNADVEDLKAGVERVSVIIAWEPV